MTLAAGSRVVGFAVLLGTVALLSACDSPVPPGCAAGMPPLAKLRADPAFSALTFHRHVDYEVRRGAGYELWGDARFGYRDAIEFQTVRPPSARSDDDVCVNAVSLRFVEPVEPARAKPMIAALLRAVVANSTSDLATAPSDIERALATGAKYALLARSGPLTVYAGRIAHPVRGEVFVVSFSWDVR